MLHLQERSMLFYLKAAVLILILTTFVSLAATKSFQPAKDKNNFDKGKAFHFHYILHRLIYIV